MNRLKILSLNTRGLRSPRKLQNVVHELSLLNCDIVFLQETHVSCRKHAVTFEHLWTGQCFWSFGTGKSAGVAVLFHSGFSGKIVRFLTDSNGKVLSLLINFSGFKLNLVNIYCPNSVSDRKIFFSRLHDFFLTQGDLVIGGDFNCVDNVLDKLNCFIVSSSDQKLLCSLCADFSLVDVWRKCNPRGVEFTWSNADHTQASCLDRFFLAKQLVSNVASCDILPYTLSDHAFGSSKRRSGVWRFNNSLLSDVDFRNVLSKAIVDFKFQIPNFASLREWWDSLKVEICKVSATYSTRKHRAANAKRIAFTKQLVCAKNALHLHKSVIWVQEAEGTKIRSHAQWFEEGEKPTWYFFRLENKRADFNTFESLFDANGVVKTSQKDLENNLVSFYKDLFTKDSMDMHIQTEIIDDLEFALTDYERELCEGLFTKDELLAALKGL